MSSIRSMDKLFKEEFGKELSKYQNSPVTSITERDIAHLPVPVQNYFRACGYIGREKMHYAKVEWEQFFLRLAPDKDWTKMECVQYNFMDEPARFAYMKTKVGGIIPFEGRDKYQDGHGNMLIKFFKIFKLGDSKGREMDNSALVTILAEALFLPTYALEPYIQWEAVDEYSAKATITHNSIKASGIFYFNDKGECTRFDTNDRYFAEKDGSYSKVKWSAYITNYTLRNGIKFPSELTTVWHTPNGDYPYFKGTIRDVKYNWQL